MRVTVEDCLGVRSSDRVLVLADEANREIGEALHEIAASKGEAYLVLLEDFGDRPLKDYPWQLREYVDFIRPTVTIYAATAQPGELPLRKGFISHVTSLGARHAHMPGVTKEIFETGLRECSNVKEITKRVYEIVKGAREVEVYTEKGTELHVTVGKYRWVPDTGEIPPGSWGNLPAGEVFTTPDKIEGVAVADGSLGDYFKKYGKLKKPLVFTIEDSQLVDVKSEDVVLAEELWRYVSEAENGTRVGEFAVGTNVNIREVIGNLLQDEKIPGVHIAFGDPLGEKTGAEWKSDVHVDAVITRTDVKVDGTWLMRKGEFLLD